MSSLAAAAEGTSAPAGSTAGATEWLRQLVEHGLVQWRHEENNIGLLLSSLLEISGWQGDVLALCDALPTKTRLVEVNDLLSVMAALGYSQQRETIHSRALQAEDLPGLFIPDQATGWQRGIVLREWTHYGMLWADGRETHRGELPAQNGVLYRFTRSSDEDAFNPAAMEKRNWLAGMISRFRPLLWQALGLSLLMQLFTLAMPVFSMVVYDRVISAQSPGSLPLMAVGVILALLTEQMIRWVRVRLAGWIGARSGLLCTAAMLERLLFLPASVIEQASVSSQLARIRAFESIRDFITGPVFLSILEIPFLFVLVFAIALLAGPVAWIAIGMVFAQAVMIAILRPRWKALGKDTAHMAAQRQQVLMDLVENLEAMYIAGLSWRTHRRFKQISWQAAKANYRFGMSTALVQHIAQWFTIIASVATLSWSLERIWAGEMTGGAMVATMIITWRVLYPLNALCSVLPHLEQIRASLKQVSSLMAQVPEAHATKSVLAEHMLKGAVNIQNLGLRYGRKSDPVFMGLSCDVKPGEIIAVYGGNGSGKSSVLRMLTGLYAPVMGNIRLDGVDHRQFDPRSLRRQVAYLPQLPELLPGTIAENLRVQDPLAPEYRLRQALLWSDAWEMIQQLPAGLHTLLGEEGYTPSAGLASRINLARLYLMDRKLVLCDELAAPLLNSTTGERFRHYLQESRGQRTVFYVTHREDWLTPADRVIWLRPDSRPLVVTPELILSNPKGLA